MIPRALDRFVAMMSHVNPAAATGEVLDLTDEEQFVCALTTDITRKTRNNRLMAVTCAGQG